MAPVRTRDQSDSASTSGTSSRGSRKSQATNIDACTECGKVLSRRHDLKRHMRTHQAKDKPCTFFECNYKSRTEAELRLHVRRHTQEKPHVCEDDPEKCHYASPDAAGLLRHRVKHHKYTPRTVTRPKTHSHRVPVNVMSHLRDNGDESAQEGFRVFSAGKQAGMRTDSDEELDQLDSSSDESVAPRSFSASASASAPSAPSDNDAMVYSMMGQPVYLPQVFSQMKHEPSVLDAALVKYPFWYPQLLAPPFWNATPADQSMESFQGWNTEPDVEIRVVEQKEFEIPGQGTHELFSFALQEDNYVVASPPPVQLNALASQTNDSFNGYLFQPADEFNCVEFGTIASQASLETLPVEGLQSVDLDSHDWASGNDVYLPTAYDNLGLLNMTYPSIDDNNLSFGQIYEYNDNFSGQVSVDNHFGNYNQTTNQFY